MLTLHIRRKGHGRHHTIYVSRIKIIQRAYNCFPQLIVLAYNVSALQIAFAATCRQAISSDPNEVKQKKKKKRGLVC